MGDKAHFPRDPQRKALAKQAAALAADMLGIEAPALERRTWGRRSSYAFSVPPYMSVRGPVDYVTIETNTLGLTFHSRVDNDHPAAELPLAYPGYFPTQKWNHYVYEADPATILTQLRSMLATLEPAGREPETTREE